MNNPKNKRTIILAVILVGLMALAYKVMFVTSDVTDFSVTEDNAMASSRVESILQQVESIRFDTKIMQDEKFKSLKSIETPLVSLPVGKKDPFSAAN